MRTTSSSANFSRKPHPSRRLFSLKALFLCCCLVGCFAGLSRPAAAQTEVTGGFIGYVKDRATGQPLAGASVQFVNQKNGFETAVQSDDKGYFVQGNLQPGIYTVNVSLSGYAAQQIPRQVLIATRSNPFQPLSDVLLEREGAAQPTPTNGNPPPATTPTPPATTVQTAAIEDEALGNSELGSAVSPRRDQVFTERSIVALPLGGSTLTRTFDELALLAPGVAPAPQAIGNTVGPGVGGGVGTSGQFSVNGLRSRANNFTVDGSDNNDEDIGVRRQGFFSLVPQPIESIQEFNISTLR